MNIDGDFPPQLQLRPSESTNGPDIPRLFRQCQFRLQNDRVLSPANGHGLSQYFRRTLICPAKLPHPAEVPGGEAGSIRVSLGKILSCGDSGAFLQPITDKLTDLIIQLHLRYCCYHQHVQRLKHGTVVYGLSDVHEFLLLYNIKVLEVERCPHFNNLLEMRAVIFDNCFMTLSDLLHLSLYRWSEFI